MNQNNIIVLQYATDVNLNVFSNDLCLIELPPINTLIIDSISVNINDKILIKDQTDKSQNGIYEVTTLNPYKLTRINMDIDQLSTIFIKNGVINLQTWWCLDTEIIQYTPGVTELIYIKILTRENPTDNKLFVNNITGNDTNIGSSDFPVKTINRALQIATGFFNSTICVSAGSYDLGSGPVITASNTTIIGTFDTLFSDTVIVKSSTVFDTTLTVSGGMTPGAFANKILFTSLTKPLQKRYMAIISNTATDIVVTGIINNDVIAVGDTINIIDPTTTVTYSGLFIGNVPDSFSVFLNLNINMGGIFRSLTGSVIINGCNITGNGNLLQVDTSLLSSRGIIADDIGFSNVNISIFRLARSIITNITSSTSSESSWDIENGVILSGSLLFILINSIFNISFSKIQGNIALNFNGGSANIRRIEHTCSTNQCISIINGARISITEFSTFSSGNLSQIVTLLNNGSLDISSDIDLISTNVLMANMINLDSASVNLVNSTISLTGTALKFVDGILSRVRTQNSILDLSTATFTSSPIINLQNSDWRSDGGSLTISGNITNNAFSSIASKIFWNDLAVIITGVVNGISINDNSNYIINGTTNVNITSTGTALTITGCSSSVINGTLIVDATNGININDGSNLCIGASSTITFTTIITDDIILDNISNIIANSSATITPSITDSVTLGAIGAVLSTLIGTPDRSYDDSIAAPANHRVIFLYTA